MPDARSWLHAGPRVATVWLPNPALASTEAMGIPAFRRLRKPREFLQVRSLGHRIHCGPFIFQCRLEDSASSESASPIPARLGIIASRRVGNAVKRNYGKRLFREIFRHHAERLPRGSEVVVVLRSHYDRYTFQDLERRFLRAVVTMRELAREQAAPTTIGRPQD